MTSNHIYLTKRHDLLIGMRIGLIHNLLWRVRVVGQNVERSSYERDDAEVVMQASYYGEFYSTDQTIH